MKQQFIRLIDIAGAEERLLGLKTPDRSVEEFYRFGTILFSELQQRGAEVDRKLTNVLGWSLATLAFIISSHSKYPASWAKAVILGAAILAFACVAVAALALKTRVWVAPSEADWFKGELWDDPEMLKRYHVVSLLTAHQAQIQHIETKAEYLGWLEILISLSALALLSVLLFF